MTLKSAPYWWLTCDGEGCGKRFTENGEGAAWNDAEWAMDEARESDWCVEPDGTAYCDDCARNAGLWYCEGCGDRARIVRTGVDGDHWCADCLEDDVVQPLGAEAAARLAEAQP